MRTSTVGCYFAEGSEGLKRLATFKDKYRGAEDRAKLQGHLYRESLARSTVDALNEGRKYYLPIYNSH